MRRERLLCAPGHSPHRIFCTVYARMCKTVLTHPHSYYILTVLPLFVRIVSLWGAMDTYYTVQELADRLKVHKNTIANHIKAGRLPAIRVGTVYRIRASDAARFLGEVPQAAQSGARVVVVANQKGGVGKTTTSVNLAAACGVLGKRTLLIDLDPQGGCSNAIGINADDLSRTIKDVLREGGEGRPEPLPLRKVIMRTRHDYDMAPSNIDLMAEEFSLRQELNAEHTLRTRLEAVSGDYDVILIDTPPSLGILTLMALTAAHSVIVPVSAEYMSLRGVQLLLSRMARVKEKLNPALQVEGFLITKYTETRNSQAVAEAIAAFADENGLRVYPGYVPSRTAAQGVPIGGQPLMLSDPDHAVSQAYMLVAQEVLLGTPAQS